MFRICGEIAANFAEHNQKCQTNKKNSAAVGLLGRKHIAPFYRLGPYKVSTLTLMAKFKS